MIIRLPVKEVVCFVYIARRPLRGEKGGERRKKKKRKRARSRFISRDPGEISRSYSSKFVELSYRWTSRRVSAPRCRINFNLITADTPLATPSHLGFPIKNRRGSIVARDSRSRGSSWIERIKFLDQLHLDIPGRASLAMREKFGRRERGITL